MMPRLRPSAIAFDAVAPTFDSRFGAWQSVAAQRRAVRAELLRVVEDSPLWDKHVCGLQVTNLSERTMELRCLVSSPDSGKNFDLRCLVREKMIEFLRINYPHALPTMRVELKEAGHKPEEPGPLPPPVGVPES